MRLQQSDPIFNIRVNVMRPAFNFEPKYMVTMLTREEWSRRPGTPVVKGLFWCTDESRMTEETGAGVCGQYVGRRLSISLGSYGTVFQAEKYVILVCAYEIQLYVRAEKYVSICCDSQAALEALSGHQNNVAIGATVPKGVTRYLYLAYCRAVLGPWTSWVKRK
jgi:hypothetical protein